ncbi:MAG: hypothetical protein NXH79_12240 [Rhodobacteraceae bacterium]|jgi:hypothetical protein|nr:hypothetical protein [Paracoccaceae bacterium]
MSDYVEYASRSGHTGLSLITLGGLCGLAGFFWHITPGFVILLLIPALLMCMYQTVVSPVFGLRMGRDNWVILDGPEDYEIPSKEIAYLRMVDQGKHSAVSIVLRSGEALDIPLGGDQQPLDLIRDATNLGIPVRSA